MRPPLPVQITARMAAPDFETRSMKGTPVDPVLCHLSPDIGEPEVSAREPRCEVLTTTF